MASQAGKPGSGWTKRHWAIASVSLVVLAAGAVIAISSHGTRNDYRAAMAIAGFVLAFPFLIWEHIVVGKDNRLSTSKVVAALWTYLVASLLLGLVLSKLYHHPAGLDAMKGGLTGQYALLIGGPIGAAILAKLVVSNQVANDPGAKRDAEKPGPADLVTNDAGEGDLGDLQYVLFNLVTMVFVVWSTLKLPGKGLPDIPDVLLGLTSVSAVGYVGKKALPGAAATATMTPTTGGAGTPVTLVGKGLLVGDDRATADVTILFGGKAVPPKAKTPAGDTDVISVEVPGGLQPNQPVPVVVVTAAPTAISAGSFRPT
jgi:hypothetical protein